MLKRPRFLPPQNNHQRGQNVVEYVLLTVAVLIIVIAFVAKGGYFRNSLENIENLINPLPAPKN